MKLELKRVLVLLVMVFSLTMSYGCASSETPKLKADMEAMKSQVWDLQKRLAEQDMKARDQENLVALMSERVQVLEEVYLAGQSKSSPGVDVRLAQAGLRFKDLQLDEIYRNSLVAFNEGHYDLAEEGFSYIVRRYPKSDLAPKAQYWIGEIFYSKKRYSRAAEEYRKIIVRYPKNPKVASAMLKVALCKMELKKYDECEKTLNEIIARFPESSAAATAKEKLKEMAGTNGN